MEEKLQIFPPKLRKLAQAQLGEGETVVWAGQSKPFYVRFESRLDGVIFMLKVIPTFGLGEILLIVLVGGLFEANLNLILPGLLGIVLVGLSLWLGLSECRKVGYVLTNQRALIVSSSVSKLVKSYYQPDINDLTVTERGDGSGDLLFTTWQTPLQKLKHGFYGIREVRRVENLLREVFQRNGVYEPPRIASSGNWPSIPDR